ncbi:MAG: molecular chaperone TorD family protein [Thiogranum sp.]
MTNIAEAKNRDILPDQADMSSETKVDITRSRMYHLLALGFSFPDGRLGAALPELQALATILYPDIGISADSAGLASAQLEAEYINVFDGQEQKRCCKPYEGQWLQDDRARRQWEVKKFYSIFGLRLNEQRNEMPDHISHELEFMHFLSYQMVASGSAGRSRANGDRTEQLRLAQKDFLERHVSQWVPEFCRHLPEKTRLPFYLQLAELTGRFVIDDLHWIRGED